MKNEKPFWKSLLTGLAIALVIVVYAYGFQVTQVNFEETRSERRLTQLTRIIRALAHPEILEYEQEETNIDAPFYLPCPDNEVDYPEPDKSGPYIELDPYCEDAEGFITVHGENFTPGQKGPINFIAASGVSLNIGNFTADSSGNFDERVQLPNRQPVEEAQIIRAIARINVGLPQFSSVAVSTFEKIIETVFLALLATTFGTLIAIPISFLAAQNLMSDVKSPLTSVALMVLGWLIGIGIGYLVTRWATTLHNQFSDNLMISIAVMVVSLVIAVFGLRWAIMVEDDPQKQGIGIRAARIAVMLISGFGLILATGIIASLLYSLGDYLKDELGFFGFLGYFIAQTGEMIRMIIPLAAALVGGAIVGGSFSNIGLTLTERLSVGMIRLVNVLFSALATASIFFLFGALVEWLYQINDPVKVFLIPAAVGALIGGIFALRVKPKQLLPIGIVIYTVMRTILNAVRSIEPLIYVIVFVVWVGIGPFAGALALALHTIAALAKLYSEQVESILPGPLEAVTATGATRIQTIMYAVVPQIIPPYISFTMYRWDINVRMSTIIGFAGGGGIGFLLQQNIRLLDYRAAAVQMLAIALVVASMDYVSSALRKRFV